MARSSPLAVVSLGAIYSFKIWYSYVVYSWAEDWCLYADTSPSSGSKRLLEAVLKCLIQLLGKCSTPQQDMSNLLSRLCGILHLPEKGSSEEVGPVQTYQLIVRILLLEADVINPWENLIGSQFSVVWEIVLLCYSIVISFHVIIGHWNVVDWQKYFVVPMSSLGQLDFSLWKDHVSAL